MKNESYVERYHREQKEKAERAQKPQKGKAVKKDGQNTRSERPDTQKDTDGQSDDVRA